MGSKGLKENTNIPNINFIGFQIEISRIIKDIKNQNKKSGIKRLLNSKHENPHVDGTILLDDAPQNKEVGKLIKSLASDPTNALARLRLVNLVLGARKDHHLQTHLNMMLQASIPIYLGEITPTLMQCVLTAYRAYLERLANVHKHKMMSIKSKQLKNVNMSGIDIDDEFSEDLHVDDVNSAKTEIQIAEALIGNCEGILQNIKTKMNTTLSSEELEELISGQTVTSSFFGGSEEKINPNKQNMIISKAIRAIEILKQVPLLQNAGLDLAKQLGNLDKKLTYPLVMEGRINMQLLKYQLLRIENGDKSARENMAPVFNLALVAYRKALKLINKSAPTKADLPVLTEFANLTHYGFVHRDLMRFTEEGLRDLLNLGKDSIDSAIVVDDSYIALQRNIENSLLQLEESSKKEKSKFKLF